LFVAAEQTTNAFEAYSEALKLDPNFANARYLRALLLVDLGQIDQALEELRLVAETNADNAQLLALIGSLESGDVPDTSSAPADLLSDGEPTSNGSGVTSPINPGTNLVTPLNTVSDANNNETEFDVTEDPVVEEGTQTQETIE
jgi:tetratricopeptide (TPR) repeat protein